MSWPCLKRSRGTRSIEGAPLSTHGRGPPSPQSQRSPTREGDELHTEALGTPGTSIMRRKRSSWPGSIPEPHTVLPKLRSIKCCASRKLRCPNKRAGNTLILIEEPALRQETLATLHRLQADAQWVNAQSTSTDHVCLFSAPPVRT